MGAHINRDTLGNIRRASIEIERVEYLSRTGMFKLIVARIGKRGSQGWTILTHEMAGTHLAVPGTGEIDMLSRRRFMNLIGTGGLALASLPARNLPASHNVPHFEGGIDWDDETLSFNEIYSNPPLLGRVHGAERLRVFKEPTPRSESVQNVYWGYVGPIYRAVHGEQYDNRSHSTLWFETTGGYIHSAFFVPCHEIFQEPEDVPPEGFWGEVSVPYSNQHREPSLESFKYDYDYYKGYWLQMHRVLERANDNQGRAWYRLYDDIEPKRPAWVQARHIRRVARQEFDPISPEVLDKRIVIDLEQQRLTCNENGIPVFETLIASGTSVTNDQGKEVDFSTPYGTYFVQRKRPSRRMQGGRSQGAPWDVNGVPWVTYFTYTGAAVHGAYWHNNFGKPRSRGCINVTPDAAKWIYRWSQPYLGYEDEYRWTGLGELATVVEVI